MDEDLKKLIRTQSRSITVLSLIVLLLLLIILFMVFCEKPGSMAKAIPEEKQFFCGTDMSEQYNSQLAASRTGLSGEFEKGKKLFKQNCAVCHTVNKQQLTGPGLAGIFDRVPAPAEKWIRNYILDSEKVKTDGDPYALKLHAGYKGTMIVFSEILTEDELNNLVYFLAGY